MKKKVNSVNYVASRFNLFKKKEKTSQNITHIISINTLSNFFAMNDITMNGLERKQCNSEVIFFKDYQCKPGPFNSDIKSCDFLRHLNNDIDLPLNKISLKLAFLEVLSNIYDIFFYHSHLKNFFVWLLCYLSFLKSKIKVS